ncbi:unnamed protein product [Symbiodinium sp. CCMP2592]|nr:unnamed protein product [Symbiodinium sp. CCMP2592]
MAVEHLPNSLLSPCQMCEFVVHNGYYWVAGEWMEPHGDYFFHSISERLHQGDAEAWVPARQTTLLEHDGLYLVIAEWMPPSGRDDPVEWCDYFVKSILERLKPKDLRRTEDLQGMEDQLSLRLSNMIGKVVLCQPKADASGYPPSLSKQHFRDGPWRIRDGIEWLRPLDKTIRPPSISEVIRNPGDFILAFDSHFMPVRHQNGHGLQINSSSKTHLWSDLHLSAETSGAAVQMLWDGGFTLNPYNLDAVLAVVPDDHALSELQQVPAKDYQGGKNEVNSAQRLLQAWTQIQFEQPPPMARRASSTDSDGSGDWEEQEQDAPAAHDTYIRWSDAEWIWSPIPRRPVIHGDLEDVADYVGGSDNNDSTFLLQEILAHLPQYFFSPNYLRSLATCCKALRKHVLQPDLWYDKNLFLNDPEMQDAVTVRQMERLWSLARTITCTQPQLASMRQLPFNARIEWNTTPVRLAGIRHASIESTHCLLGSARLLLWPSADISVVYVGLKAPNSGRRSFVKIHDLFTERMGFSFGMAGHPPDVTSHPVQPSQVNNKGWNEFMLLWTERFFSVHLNQQPLGFAHVRADLPVSPSYQCPGCPLQLSDYVGGSNQMSAHLWGTWETPYRHAGEFFLQRGEELEAGEDKFENVVLQLLREHQEFLRETLVALLFVPHPQAREDMSKRVWERVMYRARAILDFLIQKKDVLLFRFLHAEAEQLSNGKRNPLLQLQHPSEVDSLEDWRLFAVDCALQLHVLLFEEHTPHKNNLSGELNYSGGVLPPEILETLPGFFFSFGYLRTLACVSPQMCRCVRNREHWWNRRVFLTDIEFQDERTLRSMVYFYTVARLCLVDVRQLAMFHIFPERMLLDWTASAARSVPRSVYGFTSDRPLMGFATFDLVLPNHAVGLYIGVQAWRGANRAYCRVDNLFREDCSISFALNDMAPQRLGGRERCQLRPGHSHRVKLQWDQHTFRLSIDGAGISAALLPQDTEDAVSPLARVFTWVHVRPRQPRAGVHSAILRPVPSRVRLDPLIHCALCHRAHRGILLPRWAVCPLCDSWICAVHCAQTPWRLCPHCPNQLLDYVGGSHDQNLANTVSFFHAISLDEQAATLSCVVHETEYWQDNLGGSLAKSAVILPSHSQWFRL